MVVWILYRHSLDLRRLEEPISVAQVLQKRSLTFRRQGGYRDGDGGDEVLVLVRDLSLDVQLLSRLSIHVGSHELERLNSIAHLPLGSAEQVHQQLDGEIVGSCGCQIGHEFVELLRPAARVWAWTTLYPLRIPRASTCHLSHPS